MSEIRDFYVVRLGRFEMDRTCCAAILWLVAAGFFIYGYEFMPANGWDILVGVGGLVFFGWRAIHVVRPYLEARRRQNEKYEAALRRRHRPF